MPDNTKELTELRDSVLDQWTKVMEDASIQFFRRCQEEGLKPEWFYPRTVVTDGNEMRIHWTLRPEVEAAMSMIAAGESPEVAAKKAVAFGQKSLDELITDDEAWK